MLLPGSLWPRFEVSVKVIPKHLFCGDFIPLQMIQIVNSKLPSQGKLRWQGKLRFDVKKQKQKKKPIKTNEISRVDRTRHLAVMAYLTLLAIDIYQMDNKLEKESKLFTLAFTSAVRTLTSDSQVLFRSYKEMLIQQSYSSESQVRLVSTQVLVLVALMLHTVNE